ncbi:MAG: AI-2E family transporter [Solirubrobacterales bacterium]|nr:AI-2E family transporter [Solirubrobacterales bacterium]
MRSWLPTRRSSAQADAEPDGAQAPEEGLDSSADDREDDREPDGNTQIRHPELTAEVVQRPPPVPLPSVIVPRWVQLVLLPLALLGLWALARASGPVVLILIVAGLVALVLNPLVKLVQRGGLPRGLAIFAVYFGFVAVLAGIGVLLVNPISAQITHFERDVPNLVNHANRDLANLQTWLDKHGIKLHIQKQGQTALQTLQKDVLKRSSDIVSFSQDLLSRIVTVGFDLILILVLSIYLLIYGKQIGELVRRIMPDGDGTPEDDFPLLVQRAVSGYVRGQLLFSLVMGASAAAALALLGLLGIFPNGETYAVFFGGFYGLMEFIPYIGPIIGPLPAVVVALFHSPITALWVILLFVALQQLEGHVVAPQVFRISLRINPILIILALLVGYQLYGIGGALIALPTIAVIRQTVLYLRRHLVLEPWTKGSVGAGSGVMEIVPDRCPDCGTETSRGDAFCRSCGASLELRVNAPH